MATSFISERSAEYILIPKLCKILTPHFNKIIPLYFWSSREGSNVSRECSPLQKVKIVNIFARRPKILSPNQSYIEMKLNETLLKTVQTSLTLGIPTIAGVPLASSVFELTLDAKCLWFNLMVLNSEITYQISLDGKILSKSDKNLMTPGLIKESELIEKITSKCRVVEWREAVEHLRTIRRGNPYQASHFIFGGGYRPFHLILLDKDI